jgi:hypothetical protein
MIVEIDIELESGEDQIESQLGVLCMHLIRVEDRILCVPEKGKLVDVVLLLMRNKVRYQLKKPSINREQ